MPKILRQLLPLLLGVSLVLSACGDDSATDAGEPDTGAGGTAPGDWPHDFEANLIGGGTIDAGDYAGQDLVLWFWAPW